MRAVLSILFALVVVAVGLLAVVAVGLAAAGADSWRDHRRLQ